MSSNTLFPENEAGCLNLPSAVEVAPSGIVSRTLLQSPEMRVVLFAFDEGQELTPHTSPHRALVQILGGRCDFFYNDTWHAMTAGDCLHMPPGMLHAVKASSGPFTMLLTLGSLPPKAAQ